MKSKSLTLLPETTTAKILRFALGLFFTFASSSLTAPDTVEAADFHVAAGDVYGPNGLVAAIHAANGSNGNQIILEPGVYTLNRVDNSSDGPNGLPSITSTTTISNGMLARSSPAVIQRDVSASTPSFRILHVGFSGALALINVVVKGGKVSQQGGGLFNRGRITFLINTVVMENEAGQGGGIFNSNNGGFLPGFLSLASSTIGSPDRIGASFSGNRASSGGGGILNEGTLIITDSTISKNDNDTSGGGGISNFGGTITLENSTVSANTSGAGGGTGGAGIRNVGGGTLNITNSTISGNENFSGNGRGGGINNGGTLNLRNVTITNNQAQLSGGGIYNSAASGTANLANTIITGNFVGNSAGANPNDCGRGITDPSPTGALTSLGYNLLGTITNCNFLFTTGDRVKSGFVLGPLQKNGGLTETHALERTVNLSDGCGRRPLFFGLVECAIDGGNPAALGSSGAACEPFDQRGFRRPFGARCDIGAFEFYPITLTVSPTVIAAGGTLTASWSGIPMPTPTDWIGLFVLGDGNREFIDWIYVSCSKTPGSPRASGSCPFIVPASLAPGDYELRLLANDGFTDLLATKVFTVTP